jgi:mono/diheme cytochrome c family protein
MKTTILIITMLGATPALAEGHRAQVAYPAEYKVECGSCHVAFPPGLLNKADWDKTMQGLEKHFGADASLDDKTTASIANWLRQHAGMRGGSGANPPRITTSTWFKGEHREVAPHLWKDARIKSPANCAACHTGAEQGRFGEGEISIPGQGRRYEDD